MAPVPFTPGFSDFFVELATPGRVFSDQAQINQMFGRLNDYSARTVRCSVYWDEVEPSPGYYDWSRYSHLILQAYYGGFKILPLVFGAPSWASRTFIGNGLYYPNESSHSAYGNFVAQTLSHFGSFGVTRAVEVWNEPNLSRFFVPASTYKGMLNAALAAVYARTYPFQFTVVSGGLFMDRSGNWQDYLRAFMGQCYPYAVGIHPYDITSYAGWNQNAAVTEFVNTVKQKYQETSNIVTTDIWVTEFGCSADPPFLENGKSNALQQLVGASGYFASRARCKAVLLYRFLPQATLPDDNPALFATYPMLTRLADGSFQENEPTRSMLQSNWYGAPS